MHVLCHFVLLLSSVYALPSLTSEHYSVSINMPDVRPSAHDAYLCTARKLNPIESYIVQYEPDADGRTAHHMLLFGCKSLHSRNHLYPGYWECGHGDLCNKMTVMYGWAKNAPAMVLPPDVGFLTGGNSSIQYLVLQVHYANPLPEGVTDNSGIKLDMTTQRQRYITGIHLLLADSAEIPPHKKKFHVDVNCRFESSFPIHPFAFRVHTHKLGTVVTGYKFSLQNNSWTFLSKGNPQWPQAFYPLNHINSVTSSDVLAARCTYDSSRMNKSVLIGSSSSDEMCNLYLMYYTEYRNLPQIQSSPCVGVQFWDLIPALPPGNDVELPPNPELEQQAHSSRGHGSHAVLNYNTLESEHNSLIPKVLPAKNLSPQQKLQEFSQDAVSGQYHSTLPLDATYATANFNNEFKYKEVSDWPSKDLTFGQIAAVTIDNKANVAIFHRGNHVWNERSFDVQNNYLLRSEGPILVPTVIVLDPGTGHVLNAWGSNLFYMPHGLFVNEDGSYWLTDVALHQVFKFMPPSNVPLLTFGERFVPGSDKEHFCKPTSVAVAKNGEIYIADGYCNSRILMFSSEGKFLNKWGKQDNFFELKPMPGSFRIPHKVVLIEDQKLVCVADRENGRIQCFTIGTGYFRFQIQRPEFGGTLYSIAYSSNQGGLLYAVCGEALYKDHLVKAFVFNITSQKLLNIFSPNSGTFTRPHDIAVSGDCEEAFVCEIGPNLVWKFTRDYHKSSKKVLVEPQHSSPESSPPPSIHPAVQFKNVASYPSKLASVKNVTSNVLDEVNNFETSMIIMSFLAIPVLLLILITVLVRLRKRGKLQQFSFVHFKGWLGGYRTPHPQDRFNIGNLLNPHKGFDRVAVDESDGDADDGNDSDVEEFSAITKKA